MKTVEGSEQFFPADLVLLSMGFLGPEDRRPRRGNRPDPRKKSRLPPVTTSPTLPASSPLVIAAVGSL